MQRQQRRSIAQFVIEVPFSIAGDYAVKGQALYFCHQLSPKSPICLTFTRAFFNFFKRLPLMFHHRPLEEKDIPTICELPQNADELFYMFPRATYPLTASQLSEALETRHDSTVIEMDGEVVGFANFSQCKFRGRCSLGNVIIAPKARSKGVGRYMITSMMGIAFDKHEATELIASCYNHNVPGLLFYPRMGFRPYAIEEKRDKKGARVALIHLRLSGSEQ
ncbi:GNAT family acetyltransferase [Pseudomonas amygdali pv. mori]|uniref:Acetyltransferase n=3 Tax=Pseudomonas syringae group genomosp. 2 TaxID=251698 RepID=A0A0P9UW77_PSEA0|nr:Acetyltransferase [Pseudomonas amygdali pv. mori]RMQ40253.1 GNAT family acetyltransferase [Pseudomonas amygdali pv. mori]RMR42572.1 GNAT family acetyltransferase [Pseudomonas amygdali pv. mori]RMT24750.1 Acetyltransferase [Pseudomonas amygdali pv. mori]